MENIEKVEERRKFIDRVLKGEKIQSSEWFQWVANAKDCNVFLKNMSIDASLVVFLRMCESLPVFGPIYREKGWGGIIDAAEKHLISKGRELVMALMSDLNKNQEKIDSLNMQLNKMRLEVVPALQLKVNEKETIRAKLEETGNDLKATAFALNISQRDLRIKIVEYDL